MSRWSGSGRRLGCGLWALARVWYAFCSTLTWVVAACLDSCTMPSLGSNSSIVSVTFKAESTDWMSVSASSLSLKAGNSVWDFCQSDSQSFSKSSSLCSIVAFNDQLALWSRLFLCEFNWSNPGGKAVSFCLLPSS